MGYWNSLIKKSALLDILSKFCQSHLTSKCMQADTPEETRRGLEGRTLLHAGEALLLRYPHTEHGEDGPVGDVMQNTPQEIKCSSSSIDKNSRLCVSTISLSLSLYIYIYIHIYIYTHIDTYIYMYEWVDAVHVLLWFCNMSKCHRSLSFKSCRELLVPLCFVWSSKPIPWEVSASSQSS